MKRTNVLGLLFALLTVLACQVGSFAAEEIPTPTQANTTTPLPTDTPTLRPTSTLRPTQTSTPTPAPIGSTIRYKTLEVTVIDVATHGLIYPGGLTAWYPSDKSDTFLDVGVLVRNTDATLAVPWSVVGVTEENGDAWYPVFASTRTVEDGKKVDPFVMKIPADPLEGRESVTFTGDTYLRLIFIVSNEPGSTILFNIGDSPYISFELK